MSVFYEFQCDLMRQRCFVHLNYFRYTFPSGQFILLSSVIVIISTFFDCHEICKNPGLLDYRKLIFGDDSHEYVRNQSGSNTHIQSHYYYYFRTIRRNQPSPVVDETFVRLTADEKIPPKFLFKFYGTDVSELTMYSHGTIEMKATKGSGTIYTDLQKGGLHEHQILNKKELLAVRSIFHRNVDGKSMYSLNDCLNACDILTLTPSFLVITLTFSI
ncbi:hypothetical protein MS3_00002448 [Schistosoma haematobium]|uniref:Uncharacterized protein n=1 Tax=Schistosoma haematobium TaxID=6185 RepID=A0A922M040_SCHHA|nr:hypothetical protein MS3_00002448 [Schistosoma haematobium]KAH9596948.1 hypothetical protein MS3_00002448 [Schistosoma haematobium]